MSNIKTIMNSYMDKLLNISKVIKSIGGDGSIHGCIVDIDYYNHIYINPVDGKITEYSNAIVHDFQKFRAPFSGKIVHIFPEQSAVI